MQTTIGIAVDSPTTYLKRVIPIPLRRHYLGRPKGHRRVHLSVQEITAARLQLQQLSRKLSRQEILLLRAAFQKGKCRSNRSDCDLIGIITRDRQLGRTEVMQDLGYIDNCHANTLDYWLSQICGGLTPSQDDFVYLTVYWLNQIIKRRSKRRRAHP